MNESTTILKIIQVDLALLHLHILYKTICARGVRNLILKVTRKNVMLPRLHIIIVRKFVIMKNAVRKQETFSRNIILQ